MPNTYLQTVLPAPDFRTIKRPQTDAEWSNFLSVLQADWKRMEQFILSQLVLVNDAVAEGIIFTDHSPSSTAVSWTRGTIHYAGQQYPIAAGSSTLMYIFWQLASPGTLQASATYPALGDDDFLIATNISGVHSINRGKPAPKSIPPGALA